MKNSNLNSSMVLIASIILTVPSLGQAQVQNPNTPVPQVQYRSALQKAPQGVEKGKTDWRKANETVSRYPRGHIDILKAEEQEAKSAAPANTPAPATAPVSVPAPASKHKH